MKTNLNNSIFKLALFAVGFLRCAVLFAETPAPNFNWTLFWSGSWEDSSTSKNDGTLNNRGEFKLNFLQPGIILRGEILGRHTFNFDLDPPFDLENGILHFNGGLYHKPTGSRLLAGVLDEWGLSARIRNPWIRSPPYTENHRPLTADLKTAASSTKNEEAYLYLSSPFLNLSSDIRLRGFLSAQTELEDFTPAFSGGFDLFFNKKTNLLLEAFYTGVTLPPKNGKTWFSDPPPLPEREFRLYAIGLLFNSPFISVSSDIAYSETFAWGTDIYGNLGICITPLISSGRITRPLSLSFAVDGAGERFVYRDGADHGEGFRSAGKIEWKGKQNSLFRVNTVLRSPGLGEDFNRSSSGLYYRFPAGAAKDSSVFRLTRISFTVDRNAVNPEKISDGLYGNMGFVIKLPEILKSSLGINLSGSVRGLAASDDVPFPYPSPEDLWEFDTARAACEFVWSPGYFQFNSRLGYTMFEKKDNIIDVSFSVAARFKHGRLSLKVESPEFPEKWGWTVSWRLEK